MELPNSSILIVDDSTSDIKILAELVSDMAAVTFATTGADAIEKAVNGDFDVILLDIVMPDMSGFDVCRRILERKAKGETSVIFVTTLNDWESEEFGLLLGAIDYISKPFTPAIVRARVRNHLLLSRTTRDLRRANEKLEKLAALDGLTGLFNRRHFEDLVSRAIERAERHGYADALLLVDIDHFKRINDTHGHAVGDRVIKAVTEAWTKSLRPHDIVGRIGGEEFAIYLPQTEAGDASLVIERLMRLTRNLRVPTGDGRQLEITVCIGAVFRDGGTSNIDQLMKYADKMLYQAKEQGRNRSLAHRCGTVGKAKPRPLGRVAGSN